MLQIKNVYKEYRTGDLVQKALDNVSLNLRDNEFVAILGPSGSGKTTLLNIIGGLDRYDIGITLLLLIPTNQIISSISNGVDVTASLPVTAGVILIILSIVLTLIGGIIPSKKAAKEDPVLALRSE